MLLWSLLTTSSLYRPQENTILIQIVWKAKHLLYSTMVIHRRKFGSRFAGTRILLIHQATAAHSGGIENCGSWRRNRSWVVLSEIQRSTCNFCLHAWSNRDTTWLFVILSTCLGLNWPGGKLVHVLASLYSSFSNKPANWYSKVFSPRIAIIQRQWKARQKSLSQSPRVETSSGCSPPYIFDEETCVPFPLEYSVMLTRGIYSIDLSAQSCKWTLKLVGC